MTKGRALFVIVVVLVAGAFVGGYWPEHRRLVDARAQLETLKAQLGDAEAKVRLADILGQLLRLVDSIEARNFGEAATQATAYFDRVGAEALASASSDTKSGLESIARSRDKVVTALALNDFSVLEELRGHEVTLRRALGFSVP